MPLMIMGARKAVGQEKAPFYLVFLLMGGLFQRVGGLNFHYFFPCGGLFSASPPPPPTKIDMPHTVEILAHGLHFITETAK